MEYSNRFTDNLQNVISIAEDAARAFQCSYIGSEHIVFAMLNCPDCTAYKILVSCGVVESDYREYFVRSIDKHSNINGYTPRTKHMIERALELSIDINGEDSLAGTEHMLLAVMSSSECLAMRILRALGVNVPKLASKLELAINSGSFDDDDDIEDLMSPFEKLNKAFFGSMDMKQPQKPPERKANSPKGLDPSVSQYGTDLTQ